MLVLKSQADKLGVVAQASKPSTHEAEAGSFTRLPGQPGLHSDTLLRKQARGAEVSPLRLNNLCGLPGTG